VHYLPEDPPELVARKLLRVNLSDLAAMGARPLHYVLTTALPAELGPEWLARFAEGLGEDQRRYGIDLLGGDSVGTRGPAVLSLTAIGEVAAGQEIRRRGAQQGDLVWVSGTIGDAFLGLDLLRGAYPDLAPEHRDYLVGRFRLPQPRTELGPRLSGIARAMIDVSDGLLADLAHICETSRVAAIVELDLLPLSPAARAIVDDNPDIRARLAAAGDDYELLFAARADAAEAIATLSLRLGVPVTRIGRIDVGTGVRLLNADGHQIPLEATGYRHF
jgi:thiamine-monophosphate kinase